jgi:hypothetical protein
MCRVVPSWVPGTTRSVTFFSSMGAGRRVKKVGVCALLFAGEERWVSALFSSAVQKVGVCAPLSQSTTGSAQTGP